MGILRQKEESKLIRVENSNGNGGVGINYDDYTFDESDSQSDSNEIPTNNISVSYRSRKKAKENRKRLNDLHDGINAIDGMSVKVNMGSRKLCRIENAKYLATYADPNDIIFDGSDIITETITSFSKLLRDKEKLQIWNDFIEKKESEQRAIIDAIEQKLSPKRKQFEAKSGSSEYNFNQMGKWTRKKLLRENIFHYDIIDGIEKELRDFFASSPTGVHLSRISPDMVFKRFYIMAVAQYLLLKLKCIEDKILKPDSLIEVENMKPSFDPPDRFLTEVLKQKRKSSQC